MIRIPFTALAVLMALLMLGTPANAQHNHDAHQNADHQDADHDAHHDEQHKTREADHQSHEGHQHGDHNHDAEPQTGAIEPAKLVLSRTPAITSALDNGGTPVLVEVLGVVCDFCAKAMDRTFGRRAEVAAVYVDLDTKLLNLVMKEGADLTDTQIQKLVTRAGYKTKKIHRGVAIEEASDAADPA
ncbi:MAG: cation transporter [Pseudomonadota bacterium]